MSSTVEAAAAEEPRAEGRWGMWFRQINAIARLELKKSFLGKRALLIYALAAMPLLLALAMASFSGPSRHLADPSRATNVFAFFYGALILRTVVFFGCAWIFMNLFRGDIVDRSLHYYFLAAVRREVVVAGKFVTGLIVSAVLFGGATLVSFLLIFSPAGASRLSDFLFAGPGLSHLGAYLGIVALACLGYGAVFLAIGLFFRNPIIPALALYGWEWINFLLPPVLKKVSVIHYLYSLTPVPVPEGPFAILVEPTPAWVAVPTLVVGSAVLVGFAAWRARKMEIRYGSD